MYFKAEAKSCMLCNTKLCRQCVDNPTKCIICSNNMFLKDDQCLENCPNGYFANTITAKCQICNTICLTCFGISSKECILCNNNLYYY